MNEPLISVVITTRGGVEGIGTALASLQEQTYENWEALAVDAGLPASVREGLALLSRAEPRLRVVDDPDAADLPAARDAAMQRSRGDWIAFLDSDERFLPQSLAVRLETARCNALSVVHSDGFEMAADEPTTIGVPPLAGWIFRDLLEHPGPLFPGLLVHRQAIAACGPLDRSLQHFQEWDLSIRLAHNYRFGFEVVPTFVTAYRASSNLALAPAGTRDYERVLRKHGLRMLRGGGAGLLARHYRAAAESYEHAGQPRAAARCRTIVLLSGCCDRPWLPRRARALWSRQPNPAGHQGFAQRSRLEPREVSLGLSELLGVPVRELVSEFSQGQSGHVHRVQC